MLKGHHFSRTTAVDLIPEVQQQNHRALQGQTLSYSLGRCRHARRWHHHQWAAGAVQLLPAMLLLLTAL
jgi:hypothetical protein